MECPACGFNNLESQSRCARCGVWLRLPEVPVETEPPRARRRRRVRHAWYAWRRRRGFHWRVERKPSGGQSEFMADLQLVLLTPFPGAVQFLLKRNIRGWIFAIAGLIGILWIALLPGSRWWLWGFALLVVAQVNSLCDALPMAQFQLGKRLLYSCVLSFSLFFTLYWLYSGWGMAWLLRQQGVLVPPYYPEGIVRAGDVIEVERQPEYYPGDIVMANRLNFQERNANAHYYLPRNIMLIDRILARGATKVRIRDGAIFLGRSAESSQIVPVNPQWRWKSLELELKESEYLFLPSWFQAQMEVVSPVLRQEDIAGRVTRIRWPWWRRRELPTGKSAE